MREERFDVVVIGAGPAGSRTAALTAAAGLSTLLLEKRERVGFPVRCAEAVGPRRDIERFLPLDDDLVSSPIDGFALVSPAGERFAARMPGIGFVVDREAFDRRLAGAAVKAGAVLRTSHQATGLLHTDGRVAGAEVTDLATVERYRVTAAVTVGADGVECHSPRWAGLKGSYRPAEVMSCAQRLVEGIDVGERMIEFHLGGSVAPGGYAWVFPKGPSSANAGLGINPLRAGGIRAIDYLERFLSRQCPGASRERLVVGGTIVARGLPRLATGGYLAVGEAANQNNPFSGGGIVNALEGADLAAGTIVEALAGGGPTARALSRYTDRWNRTTGRANKRFWRAAQFFYGLGDDAMERVIGRMRRTPGLIGESGVDPLRLLLALARSDPRLVFRLAAGILKR
ncbi:MAG: NAD(P)/FAD-dependent oxidoreductase [Candidatus Krumholzibacteria bacterium]|nr:NAD(P)/FAD-dependent oxidoreductase [Candidatus Krumholzibacteria bacterium]